MVFHKSVLFVSGQKKWAGWVIKESDPARALSVKNQILPVIAINTEPYLKRSMVILYSFLKLV